MRAALFFVQEGLKARTLPLRRSTQPFDCAQGALRSFRRVGSRPKRSVHLVLRRFASFLFNPGGRRSAPSLVRREPVRESSSKSTASMLQRFAEAKVTDKHLPLRESTHPFDCAQGRLFENRNGWGSLTSGSLKEWASLPKTSTACRIVPALRTCPSQRPRRTGHPTL